jgi:pimeloyl-ACP methyl ester carboxylesterase
MTPRATPAALGDVHVPQRGGLMVASTLLLLAACGQDPAAEAPPDEPSANDSPAPPESPSESPSTGEWQDGMLTLTSGGSVYYWCAGEGSPGVLLEAGTDSGGTDAYPAAFVDPLIAETTVCAYDRPGTGSSDPPPRGRRTLHELCAVQDEVLAQLPLGPSYVLVGQSGGGNLNIGCAARHPKRVAGLVTIDSYHDDPEVLKAEGFVWHDNVELVDYVHYSEELDTLRMPIGDFPVLIVSATEADPGGEKNQRFWLGLSPHSRQVVVDGPHDLQEVAPEEVVAEVLADLRGIQG